MFTFSMLDHGVDVDFDRDKSTLLLTADLSSAGAIDATLCWHLYDEDMVAVNFRVSATSLIQSLLPSSLTNGDTMLIARDDIRSIGQYLIDTANEPPMAPEAPMTPEARMIPEAGE